MLLPIRRPLLDKPLLIAGPNSQLTQKLTIANKQKWKFGTPKTKQ